MLSVKQGGMKYHFLSFWYDTTRDWTPISRTIGKHYSLGQSDFKIPTGYHNLIIVFV